MTAVITYGSGLFYGPIVWGAGSYPGGIPDICAAIVAAANGTTLTIDSNALTIVGIDPPPSQLTTANLPALYVLTGAATYEMKSDLIIETREYRVQCAIEAAEQANRRQRDQQIRYFIVGLRNLFAHYTNFGVVGVQSATVTSDTGPVEIEDRGGVFVGFEMTIEVVEYISRTYAANE